MKPILHILLKVWIQQFYQRNAGLFLFLFVVLFGIVQNPLMYHYQLMQGIVTSYSTLVIACIVWLLYACKCAVFIIKSIEAERGWLCQLQAINKKQISVLFTIVQALLFLPVTVYVFFTIGVGFMLQHYAIELLLLLFLISIHSVSIVLYYRVLFNNKTGLQLFKRRLFSFRLSKGFFSFLVWYHLYKSKLKTVAVKFSSFVLLFIPLVWNREHIDLSDFVLFFQISIAAHAVIVYDSVQFLERDFRALRNMPIPLFKVLALFVITYIVLLFPEVFFISYYGNEVQLGVSTFSFVVYYIGQMLLFTALAYEKHQKIDNYLLYIGLITVCSLLLTPLKSFGVIGCVLIVIAYTLFANNYYRYELEWEENSLLTDEHR